MRMMLVLLALLLHSVSAAADCGFILWAEESFMQSGGDKAGLRVNWTFLQTESSLAQCEAVSHAKIEQVAESRRKNATGEKIEVHGNILSVSLVRENFFISHTTRYLCVPDSIDPRPKA